MCSNRSFGADMRLRRLFGHDDGRLLVVPLDHSVTDGPIARGTLLSDLVGQLAGNGVDAVVLHRGSLRHVHHRWFVHTSLVVHLSASTSHAPDPDAKYLVSSVEGALRLGADAVSVHVNLGSQEESKQVADLAAVSDACERWNLPLVAMMYPRGPRILNSREPELIAHAVQLAADLGADLVKTVPAETSAEMADVVRDCPIPIIVAGGPRMGSTEAVLTHVRSALHAGAAGVAMGRNVFESPDPGAAARRIADLVHADHDRAPRAELALTVG